MHVMSVDGKKLGVVNFHGVAQNLSDRIGATGTAFEPPLWKNIRSMSMQASAGVSGVPTLRQHGPRMAAYQDFRLLLGDAVPWPSMGSWRPGTAWGAAFAFSHSGAGKFPGHPTSPGLVELDSSVPTEGTTGNNVEFVQSMRAHPNLAGRVGALLSRDRGEQSYIALVDLDLRSTSEL
jgi:hypothetical protein